MIFEKLQANLLATANGQQVDTMPIVLLGKRHRQGTTCISCPVCTPYMLALVDVSACQVVGMSLPLVDVHLFLSADNDSLASVFFGYVGAAGIEMRHHDCRHAGIELSGTVGELLQKAVNTMRVVLVGHHI